MIKKITAMLLCIVMLLSQTALGQTFTDVHEDGSEVSEAIGVLSELGVISGMGDGTFSPEGCLTRAQAAKIAVCIMGKTKEAVVTTDAFSDVKSTDWYSGYVNVVAKEGIITGYPTGAFGANDTLTFAQAVTIIVRLLGYNAEDVGHKWPQGYMDKANVLGLTEGITLSQNDAITRRDAALVIYRALFADMKGTKTKLITKMDKTVYEDAVILATNSTNASLLTNEVQTNKGTFTFEASLDMEKNLGKEGTLVTGDENLVIAFVENKGTSCEEYIISAVYREGNSENVSLVTEGGKTLALSAKTKLYMAGGEYSAEKLTEGINAGSSIALFTTQGSLKYAYVEEYRNQGPVTVLDAAKAKDMFNLKDAKGTRVIRKGVSATWDDIEMYDVMYYSEKTNTVYVYCDRVTGLYEKAYPMKANVSRVTVSGKEYTLSSMNAVNKLNESKNAFEIGDRVTLLFGEDDMVVDAVSLTYADYSTYGVVTGFGTRISADKDTEGRTEHYVTVMHADGGEKDYVTKDDSYTKKVGKMCSVDFEDSFALLTFVKEGYVTGFVNADMKFIGTEKMSDEIKILEYIDGDDESATVKAVSLSDIASMKLEKNDVKAIVYNLRGEIEVIYLDSVTGNEHLYGVITAVEVTKDGQGNSKGTYTLLSGNTTHKITNVYYPGIKKGDCVQYVNTSQEKAFIELNEVATGYKIENILDNVLTMNGERYILSDNAVFYAGESSGEMKTISKADAIALSGKVSLCSDRTVYTGGKIRVVRVYTAE